MNIKKNIPIVALILVGAAAFVWWYQGRSQNVQLPDSLSKVESPALELVERLKNIKINTAFFNDAQFAELESVPAPILENLPKGKTNPFMPATKQ